MNKRNANAIVAQNGASNPRPIAQALVDAIGECYTEGKGPAEDPAVFLILHQLTYLLTGHDFADHDHLHQRYVKAMDTVQPNPEAN